MVSKTHIFLYLKSYIGPTHSTSYNYAFSISLFDNGNPEEFLLFVSNFNMTLAATGTLDTGANNQYLCTVLHGE